jgi:hypothetical protein
MINVLLQGCDERHDPFFPQPDLTAFRSNDYGYTKLTFHNGSHLEVEHLSDDQVHAKFRYFEHTLTSTGRFPRGVGGGQNLFGFSKEGAKTPNTSLPTLQKYLLQLSREIYLN